MIEAALPILLREAAGSAADLAPIVLVIAVFQLGILRRPIPAMPRVLAGLAYLALGLTLFRIGITEALVPIGEDMARQLAEIAFASGAGSLADLLPLLAFATLLGFTATLIEPTLTAAARHVDDATGGALRAFTLRLVVSTGVALGLLLGSLRIVYGVPLAYLLAAICAVLVPLAFTAPRPIVPLALDSGSIATSVVTVPLIAAFGLALAEALPGEGGAGDGFGLIILASLGPQVLILGVAHLRRASEARRAEGGSDAV
jgi:Protein of unknown function (DUF1538)